MAGDLIGRRAELGVIEQFLDDLGAGPVELTIDGDPGIGKTALFDAGVDAAKDRGYSVLVVRAAEAEADSGFAGLDQLLAAVPAIVFDSLAPVLRHALEVALLRAEDVDSGATDFRVIGVALAAILTRIAAERPLVVAIDDRQWLDLATSRVVDLALRRIPGRAVGILETRRIESGGEAGEGAVFLAADDRRRGIHLGGLSLAGLRMLVEARTGTALGRASLTKLEAVSAGNPLLALEIVAYLRRRGRDVRVDELVPVPADVGRLVADRLAGLDEPARSLLEVAATLGRPELERLALVTARSTIEDAVSRAIDAGLARLEGSRLEFTHSLFASAVYASMTEARRQQVHRELAAQLPDAVESAMHLARATSLPDRAVSGRLARAAGHAIDRGAPDVAVTLLEHARRLTPEGDGQARAETGLELARVLWEVGDVDGSVDLAVQLEATLAAGPQRAAVRLLRASQLGWAADETAAAALLEEALADAAGSPLLTTRLRLRLAYTLDDDLPRAATQLAAAREALAEVEPDTRRALDVVVTLFEHEIRLRRGAPVSINELTAARARLPALPQSGNRALDLDLAGIAHEREWLILERLDDLVGARDALAAMLAHDETLGRERAMVVEHADLADLEASLGHLDAARAHALAAADHAEQTGRTPHALAFSAAGTAAAAVLAGDLAAAAAAVEDGLATTIDPTGEIFDRLRALRGAISVRLGRYAPAVAEFEAVTAAVSEAGIGHPSIYRYRGDAIEALVLSGNIDAAAAEIDRLERSAVGLESPWTGMIVARSRALLAAARGDPDSAMRWAEEALERSLALTMPVELGRAHLLLGQIRRRRKEKRLASDALHLALATFEAAGAAGWAARARAEIDRVGLRPRAPTTLTPTEDQVARLAATGLTNREVADAVVLSVKTIEGVLSRVYAKLGVRSRAELAARMAEERGDRSRESPVSSP